MNDGELKYVNLSHKSNSGGWKEHDIFWTAVTPLFFQWTGWAMLLGGLKQIHTEADSLSIAVMIAVLSFALLMHILMHASRIVLIWGEPKSSRKRKLRKREMIVSVVFSATIGLSAWGIAEETSQAVAKLTSPAETATSQD